MNVMFGLKLDFVCHDTCLLLQHMKKNRDPRWEEEFQFMVEEPPTNDKIHVEVVSTSSRNLLRPKVHYRNFFITKPVEFVSTSLRNMLTSYR